MSLLLLACNGLILLAITFQDFRSRSYFWLLSPLSLLSIASLSLYSLQYIPWMEIASNILILLVILSSIWLYSLLRYRSRNSPFDRLVGWGDVLFMLSLTGGMNSMNYLCFIVFTSITSIVVILMLRIVGSSQLSLFPFAGYQALAYVILVAISWNNGNGALFTKVIIEVFSIR